MMKNRRHKSRPWKRAMMLASLLWLGLTPETPIAPSASQNQAQASGSARTAAYVFDRPDLVFNDRDAVHVALHEPHAMHFMTSGSSLHNSSNLVMSIVSRFIVELGDILKPKIFISCRCLYMNEYPGQQTLLQQESQGLFLVRCMLLHRIYLLLVKMSYALCCRSF